MSLPAPNPPHQDQELAYPRAHLATVLALLRVLAGRRGWSRVTWWGGGFTYTISVRRQNRTGYLADADPLAPYRRGALNRLRAHLIDHAPD